LELDLRALRARQAWLERLRVWLELPLLPELRAWREFQPLEQVWLGQPRKAVHSARAFPPSVSSHLPAAVVDLAF